MRVALIDPTFRHQGHLVKLKRVGYFPLTLPRLASLFPAGTEIDLWYEKCQEIPLDRPYDLVLFTTMGSNLVRAEELAAGFRERGIPTGVGGYSVKPFLNRCLEKFDTVIVGDGEGLIPRLCEDLQSGRLQKLYENLSPSLEHLPAPRYDLIPPDLIGDIFPLEASRGCPNHCGFCAVSDLYPTGLRKRDPQEVIAEFHLARQTLGKRLYYFADANFTADMPHAKTILQGMIGQGVGWLASVDIRALQDDEFLNLARRSGCFSLQVGFETLSAANLATCNKKFADSHDYPALIRRAHAFGIPVVALLMVGFDADTPATFPALRRFLEQNRVPLAVTHPLVPIPGTALYQKLLNENRIANVTPEDSDGLHIFFQPRHFTPESLTEAYWKFSTELLSLRSIVRRFLWPGVFRNPLAWLILLISNLLSRRMVRLRLPPGTYQ